ncbi:hypothetical protein VPHD239_0047 [Vibrio phage D239]
MFKLIIILTLHAGSGSTMTTEIGGFETYEDCDKHKVELIYEVRGWSHTAKRRPTGSFSPIIYCTK